MACNLLLIAQPDHVQLADFNLLAREIRAVAPDVKAYTMWDRAYDWKKLDPTLDRPSMAFCPVPVRAFKTWRGPLFQCRRLHKSEEYTALQQADVPLPRWGLLMPDSAPDLDGFGPYVVVKPDWSGRGADVKIMRSGRVRWRPPTTDYTRRLQGEAGNWIYQEFIHTGPHPVSYRVTTLFGEPMWAWKVEANSTRRPLLHRYDFRRGETGGGMSIVSSGKGCVFSLVDEPDLADLARRAHRAFPDIPVLGVDMVRDSETDQSYVIEVNAGGYTWHVSSKVGRKIQQDFAFDIEACCNVRQKAARILAEQARRLAG